jgi:5-dehydro-4-deoxyglucarate dehydratase
VQAYTSSISNIAPKLSLELADAGLKSDRDRLSALMVKYVHPLYALRDRSRGYEVSVMKAAMDVIGLAGGPVRPPLSNVTERDLTDIRKLMEVYREYLD